MTYRRGNFVYNRRSYCKKMSQQLLIRDFNIRFIPSIVLSLKIPETEHFWRVYECVLMCEFMCTNVFRCVSECVSVCMSLCVRVCECLCVCVAHLIEIWINGFFLKLHNLCHYWCCYSRKWYFPMMIHRNTPSVDYN